MAQIPNFYYNSPYIESAARSLASALAPPDPDVVLQRQYNQFKFQEAQDAARRDDELRADQAIGRDALAQLGSLDPIMGADGKVDFEATYNKARDLYSSALLHRIDPKVAEAVAGVYGPGFGAKNELAETGAASRLNYLQQSGIQAMDLAKYIQGQNNARTV